MESHKETTLLYHQRRRQSRIGMGKTGTSFSATERRVSNRGRVSLFGRTVQACGCLCELVGRGGSGVSVQHTQQSCSPRRRKDRANKVKGRFWAEVRGPEGLDRSATSRFCIFDF